MRQHLAFVACHPPESNALDIALKLPKVKGGYLTESLEMAFVESDDVGDSVNNHYSRYHRVVNLNAFDRVSRDKSPPLLMCS
jgi:hypothetical protein